MLTHRLSRVLSVGLAFAIATTSFATTPAMARIKKPGLDSLSQECFRVQTESDKLVAEYKDASNARREQILVELRELGSYWIAAGCKALFGDISKLQRRPLNDYRVPESLVDGAGGSDAPLGGGSNVPSDPGPFLY
jgi:hypothetical protein